MLAVWGDGKFENIMQSARHKDIAVAKAYELDAAFLLESARMNGLPLPTVSSWKPIYVESLQLGRSLNERTAKNMTSLYLMSKHFLEELCGVDPKSVNYSVSQILDLALEYQPGLTDKEKLHNSLLEISDEATASKLWTLINDYVCGKIIESQQTNCSLITDTLDNETISEKQPNSTIDESYPIKERVEAIATSQESQIQKTKRKRASGSVELQARE